ncbi:ubiquitin carboxyl-terminal hydrolase 7-like isoform X2 [Dysidea avara]|uniref:ubiquitin carboxyl-terminal hydrolase 7-like isoform X2 n=1 Tax=Dysidea avara TaxID=196820 RepID=UPI00331E0204
MSYLEEMSTSSDNHLDNHAIDETDGVVEIDEDNFYKPEGVVRFSINSISHLSSSILSNPTYIRGLPWKLLVMPRESVTKEGRVKGLGVFVLCNPESDELQGYSCYARATITLVNFANEKDNHSKDIVHWYHSKEKDWGYGHFIAMQEVLDPSKGFVKDDGIELQAYVMADAPEGSIEHYLYKPEGVVRFAINDISKLSSSVLSNATYIRGLPWKLLVMPRECVTKEGRAKGLGVFVQCNPESDELQGYSCYARATITLVNFANEKDNHSKDIVHWYHSKENDWGYGNFMIWQEVLDPSKGFVKDDGIELQACVMADAPHGINWDSKKYTGYVGLKSQGATSYLNSLLQTMYFTYKFRKAVYQMPTENADTVMSVPLAMQRIFYELQHNDRAVATKKLTKSFGWESKDSFTPHDVQELSRVLLDNLDDKMKGTAVEGTIPQLFEGKMESYVKCTNVDYVSSRIETYFDIQLNIKGKKNVYESFKDYVAVETLEGENKYDAGQYGLQEAKKGVIFVKFPPVLHLHLMRFQYDPVTDTNVKINDRYEFPDHLVLDEFLKEAEATPAHYTLQAVLVHSGDNYGGHYVACLNPKGDGKQWYKFDDDVVSKCYKRDAIAYNFGGDEDIAAMRSCTNAYMLVYIRKSHMVDILQEVTDDDISEYLVKRFEEEKRRDSIKRNEAHLYFQVEVYTEAHFQDHVGTDLVVMGEAKPLCFKVSKSSNLKDLKISLAKQMGYPVDHIRMWPLEKRNNNTTRPTPVEMTDNLGKSVFDLADHRNAWSIFLEVLDPDSDKDCLPDYDFRSEVLLFYKYYDPTVQKISYVGHSYESITRFFVELMPALREKVGLDTNTPLLLYEEVKPNMIELIDPNKQLRQLEEIRDGDIICFQRADMSLDRMELGTVQDYFRELYNRVEVIFCDHNVLSDHGIAVPLDLRMNYIQMAKAVAQVLGVDWQYLQFFIPGPNHPCAQPDIPIQHNTEGSLRDFINWKSKHADHFYYEKLSVRIDEFERKRVFKCFFVDAHLKEDREVTVYVNKDGTVRDLLDEAATLVEFTDTIKKLRLVETIQHRIVIVHPSSYPVSDLNIHRIMRIDEIRHDEEPLQEDQALIPVVHFNELTVYVFLLIQEIHNTFGIPFLLPLTDGEHLSSIKVRIQNLLGVSDKDYEKYKFAIIASPTQRENLSEEKDDRLYIKYFYGEKGPSSFPQLGFPFFGLDHVNRNPKRSRSIFEKAIKIHN